MADAAEAFWNSRADLGEKAGSQDLILKQLEIEALAKYVGSAVEEAQPRQIRVLDVGCGNGQTALELAKRLDLHITGFDKSPKMIAAARRATAEARLGSVDWFVRDILGPLDFADFDVVYTERCLINLPDWESQKQAIKNIGSVLRPGGLYLAVEACQDALDELNKIRSAVGLADIRPPWHNRYLRFAEIDLLYRESCQNFSWISTDDFASTYYLLSRVINAAIAAQEEREPEYDSPINKLALRLPSQITNVWGQTVMLVWKKL